MRVRFWAWAWFLGACLAYAPLAHAADADGGKCSDDSHYPATERYCRFAMEERVAAGSVAAGPAVQVPAIVGGFPCRTLTFKFGRAPANCEPGAVSCFVSSSNVIGAPNVWDEVVSAGGVTLAGVGAGLTSSWTISAFGHDWARCEFDADVTDADCDGTGGVDVLAICSP